MRTPDLSSFHVIESVAKEAVASLDASLDADIKDLLERRIERVKQRVESELTTLVRIGEDDIRHLLETAKLIKEQQSSRQEQEK